MSDCPSVEMREALPELLHGRLASALESKVREHIATCAECAAELELLERVKGVYASAPAVDTAAIVRALPAPRALSDRRLKRTASLGVLRIAAAVILVLGGVLVLRMVTNGALGGGASTQVVEQPGDTSPVTTSVPDTPALRGPESAAPRVLAMSLSELDDLDADELETLLGALDRIESAPVAEPDTLIGSVRGIG